MSESRAKTQQNSAMSKVKAKKRNVEDDEEPFPLFDKTANEPGHLDESDNGNDDVSDSEESVFSGLEESGSDDDDDGDEEEEAEEEENCAADTAEEQTAISEDVKGGTKPAVLFSSVKKGQAPGKPAKERKQKKLNVSAEEREMSTRAADLKISSQVDEYGEDTSDEERPCQWSPQCRNWACLSNPASGCPSDARQHSLCRQTGLLGGDMHSD
ncbi:ribosome biogenesis protein bop1-like isoform X2 [Brachyhypopomus gauderio]|uniref:ribosome biogenesis protein bop1-like isoform X2 n=1 Tax=Brachyhypopomus gauderio TaxID=698409 RepID=UPI004042FA36